MTELSAITIEIETTPNRRPFGSGFYEIPPSAIEQLIDPTPPVLGAVAALGLLAVACVALGGLVLLAAALFR